jgi:hypothetical protein
VKVAIANFSKPVAAADDYGAYWADHLKPPTYPRCSLLEQTLDWGFHITAIGVHLLDLGIAEEVEFWDFSAHRSMWYSPTGVLWSTFLNEDDLEAYLARHGDPDLFVNYGRDGLPTLARLEGRCFRVHVPCLRAGLARRQNHGAECYLVDSEEYLDDRSMLYVPVVNTLRIRPGGEPKERDFVYLAALYSGKRHDIVVDAARRSGLSGHFHPVDGSQLDLRGTKITTSDWDEVDVAQLLRTSRIAVYAGDHTSNPAAMWECVAAGLPIVVNRRIKGGKHVVVPGVTGEVASQRRFRSTMEHVLAQRDSYAPRQYFEDHWDTVATLEAYLAFFRRMGWSH